MKAEEESKVTSMSISILSSQKRYVEKQAATEGFATPSEYMRQLIREDQKRKSQEHLENLLLEGLNSGDATTMTKKDWDDIRAEVQRRAALRKNGKR